MRRLFATLALLVLLLVPTTAAAAFNPLGGACDAGTNTSSACNPNGSDPVTGANGVLAKVTKIIAIVAGIAAVLMIIVASLMYVTSGGDAQRASSARNTIIYTLVGLVIISLASAIITFIIGKV